MHIKLYCALAGTWDVCLSRSRLTIPTFVPSNIFLPRTDEAKLFTASRTLHLLTSLNMLYKCPTVHTSSCRWSGHTIYVLIGAGL